jgi:hypothetical protein
LSIDGPSTLVGNTASGLGGAVFTSFTALTVEHSTVRANRSGRGGGIAVGGGATIVDSTIVGNAASQTGGGIDVGDLVGGVDIHELVLADSTITRNRSTNAPGGVYADLPAAVLGQTIIAFNLPTNCAGGGAPIAGCVG